MSRIINSKKNLILFGVPFSIIALMVYISRSPLFYANPNGLSIGITIDLVFTAPLVYFLLIRKTNIPKTTFVPFLVLTTTICTLILPPENHYYLNLFKRWVFPLIEIVLVSYIIFNVTKAVKHFNKNKHKKIDFFDALRNTCRELLPKRMVMPVVTEIAIFYYGFICWKKTILNENEFSYHKDSGTITLLIAIIFIVAIETMVLHTLLAKWNHLAAWILSFLSIYSGVQLFGFLKSMSKRPISIEKDKLYLRYGIMSETTIELTNIDQIETWTKDIKLDENTRKLSFLGELESHNIIIRLKEENTLLGLYGIRRKYKNLVLHVDTKEEFINRIRTATR